MNTTMSGRSPRLRHTSLWLSLSEKVLLVALVALLVVFISQLPVSFLQAQATSQPDVEVSINDASLGADEVAEITILVKNESPGNDIDALQFNVDFTDQQDPDEVNVLIQADNLSSVTRTVALSVPSGYYLDYVEGSTQYLFGRDAGTRTTEAVTDINGVSPLAFEDGFTVNNLDSGPDAWAYVTFGVRAVAARPTVFHPDIEFFKYVANTSRGEDLTDQRTETSLSGDEVVTVQLFIHNKVLESTAHNVRVSDERPGLNSTLTGRIFSSEQGERTSAVRLNGNGGEVHIVPGSVVLRDIDGVIVRTLTDSEVDDLFNGGYLLNGDGDLNGCWEFMRALEYKVTLTEAGSPEIARLGINKKVQFNGRLYDSVSKAVNLYDAGERVEYEITVENVGDERAEDVEIEDILPVYLDFHSCSDGCDYDSSSRLVTWNIGDLDPGQDETVSFTAEVKDILPQGDRTQENIATACADNASCRTDNAIIWIDGPDITTTRVTEERVVREVERKKVLSTVRELPVDGPGDPVINGLARVMLWVGELID